MGMRRESQMSKASLNRMNTMTAKLHMKGITEGQIGAGPGVEHAAVGVGAEEGEEKEKEKEIAQGLGRRAALKARPRPTPLLHDEPEILLG
jgi:hypothetical protein